MRRLLATSALAALAGLTMGSHCPGNPLWGHNGDPGVGCVNLPLKPGSNDPNHCGGGGGGGGATPAPLPTATPSPPPLAEVTPVPPLNGFPYTFESGNCGPETESYVDPINVIFAVNGTAAMVEQHAAHHGGWTYHDGSPQSFVFGIYCWPMDGQSASGPGPQLPGRFHMRYKTGVNAAGVPVTVEPYGFHSLADAHHEDVNWCGHVVDHNEDNAGISGFDMGRADIVDNWIIGGGGSHQYQPDEFWNNRLPQKQCDSGYSWSDGWVKVVTIQ